MNRRSAAALIAAGFALATAAAPSANATKPKPLPKPIHQKYDVSDPTPNPVLEGSFGNYCRGGAPGDPLNDEKGHAIKVVGKGVFEGAISGVVGDWVVEIRDSKGNTLYGDDVNPPAMETYYLPVAKAGTYTIWACNSNGGPNATVDITFTYKR
ncbi:MAG: hypothetical protein QOK42_154 [Frankiaceae bacterium]|jgi:hypothetical protein|nr:hypothetical protein [Frankiaceae bacterium]MDX6224251.1 hypothetical protein [Frankiales bacterium]MDX6275607.1 hypothetical protein [Frankiales bacterium]